MTDVASVRSEIKSWERSFKEEHGRPPSVEDVRNNPSISDKYRLYKKLTKASQQSALPKSGPVQQPAPLTSFNPFSPTKTKGKSPLLGIFSRSNNPFATPSRSTPPIREPSPSPAPLTSISALKLPIAPLNTIPVLPSAIVRARKRLRGEPVSPSPNKDKRRRVHSSQQPFARRDNAGLSSSDDNDEVEGNTNSSFIDDSPMKAPSGSGSRSFKVLFEDREALSSANKKLQVVLARATSNYSSTSLLGRPAKDTSSISFDDEMNWEMEDGTSLGNRKPETSSKVASAKQQLRQWAPTKDNLNDPDPQGTQELPSKVNGAKKTRKRVAVSDASDDDRHKEAALRPSPAKPILPLLLPPSPPPVDPSSSNVPKMSTLINAKGKNNNNRKKAKLSAKDNEDADEDSSASDNTLIKVVRPRSFTGGVTPRVDTTGGDEDVDGMDSDPILRYFQPDRRNSGGGFTSFISSEGEEDFAEDEDEDVDDLTQARIDTGRTRPPPHHKKRDHTHGGGSVEVNLPDKLKDLLALSASDSRARDENLKQELVVEKLLYGRRVRHYDGSKGGEIWDVGDANGADNEDNGDPLGLRHKRVEAEVEEDDWEGEPVPWEIGEL